MFYKVVFHNIQFEFWGLSVASVSPLESHPGSPTKNKSLNCLGKTPMAGPYSGLWVSSYGDLPESLRTLPALPCPWSPSLSKSNRCKKHARAGPFLQPSQIPCLPFFFQLKWRCAVAASPRLFFLGGLGRDRGHSGAPRKQ